MAGVSCQGLASWSNMLLHVWCIFLGFSRVAPKCLVCLCQFETELPIALKWLFYFAGTYQGQPRALSRAGVSYLVLTRVCQQTPKWLVYLVRVQQVGPTCSCMSWCIFLGFGRVCFKNILACAFASSQLTCQQLQSWLFYLAGAYQGQPTALSRAGVSYLVLTRVCQQTQKWLVYLCQGSASWSNHALACLVYLSRVWQGVLQKCIGMCFCQFKGDPPIASKLAFLSCWRLPRLAESSLKGWCILSSTYKGVSTNSKMAGVSSKGSASWSNHALACLVYLSRVQQGVLQKLLVCLCQLSTELPTTSKWLFYLVGTQQD